MRKNLIILCAVAVLGVAAVSANAGDVANREARTGAGSTVSLHRAIDILEKASLVHIGTRSERLAAIEPSARPVVAVKPALRPAVSLTPACQQALQVLKGLHQAGTTTAQPWKDALLAARTACLPQRSAACQAAIDSLQALVQANRPRDWSELLRNRVLWQAQLASLKSAISAAAATCALRS